MSTTPTLRRPCLLKTSGCCWACGTGGRRERARGEWSPAIDLVIYGYLYTMLLGVYLDKGRVSDSPEYAETVISETPFNIISVAPSSHSKNTSCLCKFFLVKNQCFTLSFSLNPLLGKPAGGTIKSYHIIYTTFFL